MKFKIDGRELEAPEKLPLGWVCEAEQALNLSMDGGFGQRMTLLLFIAMRQDNPNKPIAFVADDAMRADFLTMEEVEEEGPPAETPVEDEAGNQDHDVPLSSGLPLSVRSG